MGDDLFDRLKKGADNKKGPWKKNGPKVPPKRRTRPNRKRTADDDRESTVQREIVQRAALLGIELWRQQAGTIFTGAYTIKLGRKGAGDLTGILSDGRRLEVESKRRYGGVQSDDQKAFQEFIEENNGVYILAHSGDEFVDQITPILEEIDHRKDY